MPSFEHSIFTFPLTNCHLFSEIFFYIWSSAKEWNEGSSGTCIGETKPIGGSTYPTGSPRAAQIVKAVIANMSKPVSLLDVTTLSQLRKDGHPSVYGIYGQNENDCSHWCLAGVPDTWNQLLYAMLLQEGEDTSN